MDVIFSQVGKLLEGLGSSFDLIVDRPMGLHCGTLVVISDILQPHRDIFVVNGYIAEFIIDDKVSVIPTDPNDEINPNDILVPSQSFALEVAPSQGARFITFFGRRM